MKLQYEADVSNNKRVIRQTVDYAEILSNLSELNHIIYEYLDKITKICYNNFNIYEKFRCIFKRNYTG